MHGILLVLLAADGGLPFPTLLQRPVDEPRVERVFQSLTVRERLGQLILAYPQLNKTGPVEVGTLFVSVRPSADFAHGGDVPREGDDQTR